MATPTDVSPSTEVPGLVAGLEPAQREAVLADEPVVCVLAGAGTGKTRVLTLRVARRVLDESAHPSHVLVCTFSRKAAQELRGRFFALGVGREVQAGTFHRSALRLIAHHRHERGQSPPALAADRRPMLAELLGAVAPTGRPAGGTARPRVGGRARAPRSDAARLDAEIGWAKSRLVGPEDYVDAVRRAARRTAMPAGKVAELYARYEQVRRLRGLLDLDDLLWHAGDLLEHDAAFARAMRWWHRHLFVDEMQDMNDAQYRLLRLLVGDEPDLFVVGDPNQSVYGWNGADPELLHRITREFAGTRVVRLETNHRCAAPVVRVASAALGSDPPTSAREDGPVPTIARFENDLEEARWVARRAWLAHRPGRSWSSIAVLARTNAQLTRIAGALDDEHVPCLLSGAELGPASDVRGTADDTDADVDADLGVPAHGAPPAPRTAGPDRDDAGNADATGDAVVLSTFHRAKGLQWRTVFVVGVSDGLVPLVTARSSAAKAEERRLLYVAMTRAEEELTCTWALRPGDGTAEGSGERRASPYLSAAEEVVRQLRDQGTEAASERAAAHIARMRAHLADASGPHRPAG